MKEPGPDDCEVCRGVNVLHTPYNNGVSNYTNNDGIEFRLCKPCAERQVKTLGLKDVVTTMDQSANSETGKSDDSPKMMLKRRKKQLFKRRKLEASDPPTEEQKDTNQPQLLQQQDTQEQLPTVRLFLPLLAYLDIVGPKSNI